MPLTDLVNNKQLFSQKIQENASDDIKAMGLEIVNLNVQTCTDENGAIEDLGIDNLVKIQKTAKVAKAQAEKEIKIAKQIKITERKQDHEKVFGTSSLRGYAHEPDGFLYQERGQERAVSFLSLQRGLGTQGNR